MVSRFYKRSGSGGFCKESLFFFHRLIFALFSACSRPQWSESFKFEVLSLERSINVQLWDADEIGADTLLGEVSQWFYMCMANAPLPRGDEDDILSSSSLLSAPKIPKYFYVEDISLGFLGNRASRARICTERIESGI